jgi:hypothetical protein
VRSQGPGLSCWDGLVSATHVGEMRVRGAGAGAGA